MSDLRYTVIDQHETARQMAKLAAVIKPKYVLNTGDNWVGGGWGEGGAEGPPAVKAGRGCDKSTCMLNLGGTWIRGDREAQGGGEGSSSCMHARMLPGNPSNCIARCDRSRTALRTPLAPSQYELGANNTANSTFVGAGRLQPLAL